jgi:hypothetical protein
LHNFDISGFSRKMQRRIKSKNETHSCQIDPIETSESSIGDIHIFPKRE